MPDDRDTRSRPQMNVPRPIDPDATPVEGTSVAFSLHHQFQQLREDFRAHSVVDATGLESIRTKQDTQNDHITGIRVETAKQTVMLENLRDAQRKAEIAAETKRKETREKVFEWLKWGGGIVAALVCGYLLHKFGV